MLDPRQVPSKGLLLAKAIAQAQWRGMRPSSRGAYSAVWSDGSFFAAEKQTFN